MQQKSTAVLLPSFLSENETDAEKAAVALRKILAVHFPTRAYMISALDFAILDERVATSGHVGLVREIAKLLAVLWSGQPSVLPEITHATLPLLSHLLSSPDEETVAESCAGIAAVCERPERLKSVLDAGVAPKLVKLLQCTHDATQHAALLAGKCSFKMQTSVENFYY